MESQEKQVYTVLGPTEHRVTAEEPTSDSSREVETVRMSRTRSWPILAAEVTMAWFVIGCSQQGAAHTTGLQYSACASDSDASVLRLTRLVTPPVEVRKCSPFETVRAKSLR